VTRQKKEKRAANEAYADRYRRRRRKDRKKARKARVERREIAWLEASGIPRDTNWPLA
jgi:hypothetical protein